MKLGTRLFSFITNFAIRVPVLTIGRRLPKLYRRSPRKEQKCRFRLDLAGKGRRPRWLVARRNISYYMPKRSTPASKIFGTAAREQINTLKGRPPRCWTWSTSGRDTTDAIASIRPSTGVPEEPSTRNAWLKGGGEALTRNYNLLPRTKRLKQRFVTRSV